MSELLHVKNLSIRLKKERTVLVDCVDFTLEEGGSLVLLGQSGSGKTMTCHGIIGLLDSGRFQISGEIEYFGRNLMLLSAKEKRSIYGGEIAFIPQNPMTALDPSMRVGKQMLETLGLHNKMPKQCRKDAVLNALREAGLADAQRIYRSYPHQLSGGMLQRVLIAMVLMGKAKLVIADEPTTALDVVHRNETMEAFRGLKAAGTAVLMVTHDFAAAMRLGGMLMIMNGGRIIEQGRMETVFSAGRQEYTRSLVAASFLSEEGVTAP